MNDQPLQCATCKVNLDNEPGYYMCDEEMKEYCERCWPAVSCELRHGEGCATAVFQ